jgi:dihydrofolate synthase/folylpolyglutamate synthase
MKYQETLDYLYSQLPMFQRVGGSAYKKDLTNTIALCQALDNPQNKFKSIHIAGTNGKGSSSHAIAAVLQAAGYKVGLYTSPHLKDFTERIRLNGRQIGEDRVVAWVQQHKALIEEIKPSFFELTVGLAFDYFAQQKVDIAVVEVGMGGRLDSTNIISPLVSLITRIGLDHTQFLGDTLEAISREKAGIIKPGVPVVIGEKQAETSRVYQEVANRNGSALYFAQENFSVESSVPGSVIITSPVSGNPLKISPDIKAGYFVKNLPGVLGVIAELLKLGFNFTDDNLTEGLENIVSLTGLKGRYQILNTQPKTIADVSHNPDGLQPLLEQILSEQFVKLHIVLGVVADKDLAHALRLFPKTAQYYFCQAQIPRALPAYDLQQQARQLGLAGEAYLTVEQALAKAKEQATAEDLILITGSTFVVAEVPEL